MKDKVSALFDGDLDDQASHAVLEHMRRHPDLREDWASYCLIGDALRGDRAGSGDFVARVMAELEDEPTLLAPRSQADAAGRRKVWQSLMPLAASVMGVAAVGLVAATLYRQDAPPPQLASVAPVVQLVKAAPGAGAGLAEDSMREYVFAHQGLARGGPLPAGVQYVRTVSDQREGENR
ncbi:MAG: sigma-E factor negative regulatory protein [Thauera sp.]